MTQSSVVYHYQDLQNKIILITGATRGIGREIAKALAHQRAHVVFNYRQKIEDAEKLQRELLDLGASRCHFLKFDMTDSKAMLETIRPFVEEFGPISGVVNNAGISKDQIVLRMKEEDVQQTLDTNLRGPIMLLQILSRYLLKAENVSIVNVSSVVGLMGNPSQIAYSSSKAGLIGLTKSFAKELASRNIRCNAICPGFIETDMTHTLSPEAKEHYLKSIPLQRMGKSEEVAALTCFLLSKASSYITGEIIKIDGGLYT